MVVFSHSPKLLQHVMSAYTLNICTQFGQTPLHIAAGCGNYEIVKLLVNANSDVNATAKVMLPIHTFLVWCF